MLITRVLHVMSCYCYHKGTYFQANHNNSKLLYKSNQVVIATTKVRIFKQITTQQRHIQHKKSCYCYHKGTYFQANHNIVLFLMFFLLLLLLPQRYVFSSKSQLCETLCPYFRVVIATTKVRIFKQITTVDKERTSKTELLLLPQRYVFSSKSQHRTINNVIFQVVIATTKVRIFKQITTHNFYLYQLHKLLLLPQRYVFSSKSQHAETDFFLRSSCYCYHKGTYFQANHNNLHHLSTSYQVVIATTKVRIFKQITTNLERI